MGSVLDYHYPRYSVEGIGKEDGDGDVNPDVEDNNSAEALSYLSTFY